nr:unnamed protein product [Digitaria exilis]
MEPAFHREYANKQSKPHAPLAAAANDGALPTDVLHDVLLRLPADELCRLRLVCRSWRSLTSHPTFAKAHSSRHPLVIGLRSVAGRHGHRDDDLEVQLLDPFSGGIVKRIPLGSHRDLMSAHHCRLFISVRYLPESACVVNPAAPGCITKLPTTTSMVTEHESKTSTIYSVLGQVPSTGEYKALRIIRPRERWWRQDYDPKQTSYHIATLGGNGSDGSRDEDISWRVMKSFVNGVAYFLSYWKSPDEIAAFDLATEEWRHPLLRGPLSSQNITANEEDSLQ